MFTRYIGIDYSGAMTPDCSNKGIRVYSSDGEHEPQEVEPPLGPKKYWTRRHLADWLLEELSKPEPTIAGIDHSFSFPSAYFLKYGLPPDWDEFLDDFHRFWPTDGEFTYVCFVRDGSMGAGAERTGSPKWRRLAEVRARARSVFHFEGPGTVAYSTHAGLPWLRFLRRNLGGKVHFWPFDGWKTPAGRSVLVEAYPSLYRDRYLREGRNGDQHDAYSIAAWLRDSDWEGSLLSHLEPALSEAELRAARYEGWILGVGPETARGRPLAAALAVL